MLRIVSSMFRLTYLRPSSFRSYRATTLLKMPTRKTFVPKDWKIIETSPGGVDLAFVNKKTGEYTGYIPQGLSAEDILTIPAAKRRWGSIELVEEYIQRTNAQREIYGEEDLVSSRKI